MKYLVCVHLLMLVINVTEIHQVFSICYVVGKFTSENTIIWWLPCYVCFA
jgi:hypothetical protein